MEYIYSTCLVLIVLCDDYLQESAREKSQKYKEGKSVLERSVSLQIYNKLYKLN